MKAPASAGTDSEGETESWEAHGDHDSSFNSGMAQLIPPLIERHIGASYLSAFAAGGAA